MFTIIVVWTLMVLAFAGFVGGLIAVLLKGGHRPEEDCRCGRAAVVLAVLSCGCAVVEVLLIALAPWRFTDTPRPIVYTSRALLVAGYGFALLSAWLNVLSGKRGEPRRKALVAACLQAAADRRFAGVDGLPAALSAAFYRSEQGSLWDVPRL